MELGDTVTVRSTGRRARIVAEIGQGRYQVEYLPDLIDDPIDSDTAPSEDEAGIYRASDLDPV
jgi:hypothetical protein